MIHLGGHFCALNVGSLAAMDLQAVTNTRTTSQVITKFTWISQMVIMIFVIIL